MQSDLDYMYGLERFGIKPGLDVMHSIMEVLGHPELKWPSVHIAGTTGKGSTASFVASMLRQAEYTVGLYTSPHLVRFNERIQVNGAEISDQELKSLVREIRQKLKAASIQATFFEFTTALAFLYFAKKKIDIAVIEVGMGGRLDATNVITPLVSVITNIGLDHTEFLGDSLLAIAAEKAGVIKPGVAVITGEKKKAVIDCLASIAKQKQSAFVVMGHVVTVRLNAATLSEQNFSVEGQIKGDFTISLLGRHQLDNAVLALLTVNELRKQGWALAEEAVSAGLAAAVWPGRLQIVHQRPLVVIDGAHNEDGFRALFEFLETQPRHDVLVVALKKDKKLDVLLAKIVPLFRHVIVTQGSHEPWPAEELGKLVQQHHPAVDIMPVAAEAIPAALQATPPDGLLLITGSLYMIGTALTVFESVSPR